MKLYMGIFILMAFLWGCSTNMDVESDSIKEIDFVEVDAEENIGMVYFKLVKEDETDGKHIAEFDLIIENKVINVSSMDIKI